MLQCKMLWNQSQILTQQCSHPPRGWRHHRHGGHPQGDALGLRATQLQLYACKICVVGTGGLNTNSMPNVRVATCSQTHGSLTHQEPHNYTTERNIMNTKSSNQSEVLIRNEHQDNRNKSCNEEATQVQDQAGQGFAHKV